MRNKIIGLLTAWVVAWGMIASAETVIAHDNANNYTHLTFTNGANVGLGFGAWDFQGVPPLLGDSTEGGGGDINSANGFSFQIAGDGAGGWAALERHFSAPLRTGDVASFTLAYNWDGGGRGVDVFDSEGLFANLINITGGGLLQINGETVSTSPSTGSVVTVSITQATNAVRLDLIRLVNGVTNLVYATNIVNGLPAAGLGFYCGGYDEAAVEYAMFLNDLQVLGYERKSLSFISGAWDPVSTGDYEFVLFREGAVGDEIVLSSDNTSAVVVPSVVTFDPGSDTVSFDATVVSLNEGQATILASNVVSGLWATCIVTPQPKELFISGAGKIWSGGSRYVQIRRSNASVINKTVNLESTDENILAVPSTVEFGDGDLVLYVAVTGVNVGHATIKAYNDDVEEVTMDIEVAALRPVYAVDDAGNYTPETFTNGSNAGEGLGAWSFWDLPPDLGDSTAGGGGDINSVGGNSFRIVGDGSNGWANAMRPFIRSLEVGDVVTFRLAYNWSAGARGVEIFSAGGQFASLVDVETGDDLRVNGVTISQESVSGAILYVELEQEADGIALYLTRSAGGEVNLAYSTNIVHAEPATAISAYCGGYVATPIESNVNFAVFMNDLVIYGETPPALTFSMGTSDPSATGTYEFELTRSGSVGDDVVLSSDNLSAVTVPESVVFLPGSNTVIVSVFVVSLNEGNAMIIASNIASGAWAEYVIRPQPSEDVEEPSIEAIALNVEAGEIELRIPSGYDLASVEAAPTTVLDGDWNWSELQLGVDYTVNDKVVKIIETGSSGQIIRIKLAKSE